ADGRVFDLLQPVAERYLSGIKRRPVEIWKFNRQVRSIQSGCRLRVLGRAPFRMHWTADEWQHSTETDSTPTGVGQHYADIAVDLQQKAPVRFTFYWPEAQRWEGRDFAVTIAEH